MQPQGEAVRLLEFPGRITAPNVYVEGEPDEKLDEQAPGDVGSDENGPDQNQNEDAVIE